MKTNLSKKSLKKLYVSIVIVFTIVLIATIYVLNLNAAPVTVGNFTVDYSIQNSWSSGASINVKITNNGTAIQDWAVSWTFPGDQKIANMWNATYTQSGSSVEAKNTNWNGVIPTNGSQSFGFNITYSGTNEIPTSFKVNSDTSSTSIVPTTSANSSTTPVSSSTATSITPETTATPTSTGITPSGSSDLPVPPGSSNVAKPSGTAGNLKVVNWAGFKSAVSYSFDDANSSQISNYSKINALGVHYTFYLQTGKTEASNNIWAQALKDGHELGNHTQNHEQNASTSDIDAATNFIQQKFGVKPLTFAAPYGSTSYISPSQSRFLVNRGVSGGSIAANSSTDPFNLPSNIPSTGAQSSELTSTVSSARSTGNWQIFCIHGFTGGSDGAYQPIDVNQFTSSVSDVKNFGDVWMDTVLNVAAYWRAQKLVSSITPSNSGSDIVYKWTLPANFPTGKYLRVTVTGGTLKQNNQVLNWNSNGYYEIALDAGSLTISQ